MSRDLVCGSLRISLQLEAFFHVSHNMIYHTETLLFTVIIDKVKLFFSKAQRSRGRESCGSISPSIVNLGTKWAVNFTSYSFTQKKELRYPLNRRLDEPQSRLRLWRKETSLASAEIRNSDSLVRSLTTILTTLAQLMLLLLLCLWRL